ncbi:MAG TPA: YidB family protein [Candidatus Limnocylindrales bacterium]|jgi:uncharacterized protein YidB (DUF937 family)|nr:YidB family protein [Candidatus Limnocylindrales bacterium]
MDDLAGMLNKLGDGPAGTAGTAGSAAPAAALTGLAAAIGSQGGIDGILDKLRQAGFGSQVDSWISRGGNETVPPQQLGAALGDDTVQKLSASSGLSISMLLPLLASFLPQIVDMLTPDGKTPAGGVNEAAAKSGPDLGGLLGGLLGGGAGGAGGAAGGLPDLGGLLGGMLGGEQKR